MAIQELKLNHAINNHDNVVRIFKVYSWIEAEMQTKYILVLVMELALCSLKSDIDDKKKAKSRFDGTTAPQPRFTNQGCHDLVPEGLLLSRRQKVPLSS